MYGKNIENILILERNTGVSCLIITRKGVLMKMLSIMFALIAVVGLSGCNTFAGMGKDIQSGGKAVEESTK
ncbi:Predicted small secreted protein [Nitrosospira sp. Nsp14]|jgi:predicted small secreted protein|uniref:entericidin A/B family lipoprotein n=1 Tax=Nitrosospira sp. Nsp14 TaxID=1855333 RepID=UPI0008E56B5C|nr:entericidin A/B family lipoprotein [Nitrosospira sp. Nsp14]SFH31793.1 Predicted small secreted protein [Nitrosospira sp. Nsp14]